MMVKRGSKATRVKAESRDTVSKVGKKPQMLLKVQSRRNKSRELYDIRQESGFRQNKWTKMRGEMLMSMQKFQSTTDRNDEFKGHMVRDREPKERIKMSMMLVGRRRKKIDLGVNSECF